MKTRATVPITETIETRVVKTTAVSFLATGLSIITQLISVPICLHYWSKTMYGTWLSIMAAFTLLRSLDGGYTSYIGNKLNMLYHTDHAIMRKTLASAIYGVVALGIIQALIVIGLYLSKSIEIILGNNPGGQDFTMQNAVIGLLIMIISWMTSCSYIGIIHRFLIPVGMLYQLLWWMLLLQLSQSSAVMLAAYLHSNIITTAIYFTLAQAIIYIISAFYIRRKLPQFYPWLQEADYSLGLSEMINSLPMIINGLVQQIGNSGLVVLVSATLGTAMVPVYSTIRTLNNLWTTVTNIVTAPLLPDIVRYHATGASEKFFMVHRVHVLLMSIIVNFSLLSAYPVIDKVYVYWTRGKLPLEKPLLLFLMSSVSVYALNSLFNTFLTGINQKSYLIFVGMIRGSVIIMSYIMLHLHFMGISAIGFIGIAVLISETILLLVNSNIYILAVFPKSITKSVKVFTWYNHLCFLPTIFFLAITAVSDKTNWAYYIATVCSLIIGIIVSWFKLDQEVKSRVLRFMRLK